MSLREKINEQYNTALKSKNRDLISTLRLVLSAIKDKDIANRTSEKKEVVKDDEIIKVLRKMKKHRILLSYWQKNIRIRLAELC